MNFESVLHNLPYTVDGIIRFMAFLNGDTEAVKTAEKTVSYNELDRLIEKNALLLRKQGIQPGDYVMILLPNSIAYIVAIFAVMRLGAIAVPVYYHRKPHEIQRLQKQLKKFHLIISPQKRQLVEDMDAKSIGWMESLNPVLETEQGNAGLSVKNADQRHQTVIDTDPALVMFTSGSTGSPKGIVLSHRNLLTNVFSNIREFKLRKTDSTLVYLPLTYLYAFSHQLLCTFITGGTVHLGPSFFIPSQFRTLAIGHGITWFAATPPVFDAIVKDWKRSSQKAPLHHVRIITIGGAPSRPELIPQLRELFPNARIALTYGLTENAPRTATFFCGDNPHPNGIIGKILPNMRGFLQSAENSGKELVLEGASVMLGNVNESGRIIPFSGPLKTGDLAEQDREGNFYIKGRINNMINNAGHKICPSEIEAILHLHPAVDRALVYGVPQQSGKDTIQADVVLKEGHQLNHDEVYKHCRKYLSHYKIPRLIRFLQQFEWTANCKISNPILQEEIS